MGQLLAGLRITRDRRPSKPRLPVTALEIHMPLRAMLETAETTPVISARNTPDATDIGRRCGLARILNGSEN
jgi:hypothetical protein